MKVRMKVDVSGTHNGRRWPRRGEVAEVPDNVGAKLCSAGLAAPVADDGQTETAKAPPAERTQPPEDEKPTKPAADKRGRGRPRLPRDSEGNVVRE